MAECVQVAVSNATFHFDKLYSYSVPAHLQDRGFVGSMVLVPFGRGAAAKLNRLLDPLRLTAQTGRQRRIADCADLVSALTRQLRAVVQQRSVDLVANAREQDGKFL